MSPSNLTRIKPLINVSNTDSFSYVELTLKTPKSNKFYSRIANIDSKTTSAITYSD